MNLNFLKKLKNQLTKQKLHDQRLAICKSCPFYIADQDMCGQCGCFMPSKVMNDDATCPEHMW